MRVFDWLFRRKQHKPSPPWERTMPPVPETEDAYVDGDGRRHRADAPYLLPKDLQEVRRLDYQHFILRQVLKGNCFAPVHDLLTQGSHVLDVGCGTGRWGQEIALAYPQSQVIGLDLEAVPRTSSTPLNYQFVPGNLLHGLPFANGTFGYVH